MLETINKEPKTCKEYLENQIGPKLLILIPTMNQNMDEFSSTIE